MKVTLLNKEITSLIEVENDLSTKGRSVLSDIERNNMSSLILNSVELESDNVCMSVYLSYCLETSKMVGWLDLTQLFL